MIHLLKENFHNSGGISWVDGVDKLYIKAQDLQRLSWLLYIAKASSICLCQIIKYQSIGHDGGEGESETRVYINCMAINSYQKCCGPISIKAWYQYDPSQKSKTFDQFSRGAVIPVPAKFFHLKESLFSAWYIQKEFMFTNYINLPIF